MTTPQRPFRSARLLVPITRKHHAQIKAESAARKAAKLPGNKMLDVLDETLDLGLAQPVPVNKHKQTKKGN